MSQNAMSPAEATAVIEAVKRHGFDPAIIRSCMPSSDLKRFGGVAGVVGCNMWDRCPFGMTKNGGFKGQTWRPKNVIYYLEPNDGTTHAKEDVLPCNLYTQLLANKARDGRIDLEEGRTGEIIQIIGQEGDKYTENTMVNKGTPLSPKWENESSVKVCPEFVHGQAIAGLPHERDIRAKARARMALDPQASTGPPRVAGNPNDDWDAGDAPKTEAAEVADTAPKGKK